MKKKRKIASFFVIGTTVLSLSLLLNNFDTYAKEDITHLNKTNIKNDEVIKSVWGTAPVAFEESTSTLTVSSGTITNMKPGTYYLDNDKKIKRDSIKKIVLLDNVVAPPDSSQLFSFMVNLKIIEGNLDTSSVNNMKDMFTTTSLEKIDVSSWDTSKVKDMSGMFAGCNKLKQLDVGNWNTNNVVDMKAMLTHCLELQSLDVSNWDTSNVKDMKNLFYANISLSKLNLGTKSIFNSSVMLPLIKSTNEYTGRWILTDPSSYSYSDSNVFMSTYNGKYPGVYVWEVR